jgi:sigma-B regulation protein RsbU (phosphoserine phosphatase)
MSPISFFQRMSKPALFSLGILLTVTLGIADYFTGEELFFLELYLLPVLLITWFIGEKAGIIISSLSSFFWFVDDVIGRPPSAQPFVHYFNILLKFVMFVVFVHILTALKTAIQRERLAEQESLQREMDIARQVQEGLLPQTFPSASTLECSAICRPANSIGGDYYDFLQLDRNKIAIAIGDVSGKGISSALLMSNLQAMLRSHLFFDHETLDQSIIDVNNLLCLSTGKNKYATFFCAVYDETSRYMTFVNAGHNPPFWMRPKSNIQNGPSDIRVLRLQTTGTVLGLFSNSVYHQTTVNLQTGDVVVCFTDGVTEARNPNDEEFGEENLSRLVQDNLQLSANQLADLILERIHDFAGGAVQYDDLTFIILKIL